MKMNTTAHVMVDEQLVLAKNALLVGRSTADLQGKDNAVLKSLSELRMTLSADDPWDKTSCFIP